jgi:hypothetical protein
MLVTRACPACGYSASYASIPLADAHHPRHSCARQQRAIERAARRENRARTRVRRECIHSGAHHVHGTRAAYGKDRCRCMACTAANTAASRRMTRERTFGRWQPFVNAGATHRHITALREAGIGVERIAQLSGVSVSHVRELADPRQGESPATRRVRPITAMRILSVAIDDASRAPHSRVASTGTRRRLQALITVGWTPELLAAQLGRRPSSLRGSMTSRSVTARTAQDVAALYARLWNAQPPELTNDQRAAADAARAHAAAHGWLPPLAWDDIDTDPAPPAAAPAPPDDIDAIAIERALAGDGIRYDDLNSAEQQEVSEPFPVAGDLQVRSDTPTAAR